MIRKIEGSFVETRIDDEVVLVHVDRGSFHALRRTALAIWQLIDEMGDRAGIVDALTARFDVTRERCDAEVAAFLDQMREAGFVAID